MTPACRVARTLAACVIFALAVPAQAVAAPVAFHTSSQFRVGGLPRSVAIADVDRDGRLDLAVANWNSGSVTIRFGDGNGSFPRRADIEVGGAPSGIVAADFNADGVTDLALSRGDSAALAVLLGDGGGGFGAVTNVAGVTPAYGLVAADFDGDGILDLATSGPAVFRGDGSGGFSLQQDLNDNRQLAITAADFNGDGAVDLARGNGGAAGTVSLLLNDGTGRFGPQAEYPVGATPTSLAAGDFDGDGALDLAVANYGSDSVALLLNDGSGGFLPARETEIVGGPYFVVPVDRNGDGLLDVVVVHSDSSQVTVLEGDGSGDFPSATTYRVGSGPEGAAVADLNGDGRVDLAVANAGSDSVSVLLATPDGFETFAQILLDDYAMSIATADFNADGHPDFAVVAEQGDSLTVFLNDGAGGFAPLPPLPVGRSPQVLRSDDFDHDGNPDVAVVEAGANSVSVWLGDGAGGFALSASLPVGDVPYDAVTADLNADGHPDLVVANYASDSVSVWLGDGSGGFADAGELDAGPCPVSLVTADFNADGRPDVALANYGHPEPSRRCLLAAVTILLGDGAGGLAASVPPVALDPAPWTLLAADLDADGHADLLAAQGGSLAVLLGAGDGTFTRHADLVVGNNAKALALADLDGDGTHDLVVGDPGFASVSVLPGDGASGFGPAVSFDAGSPQSLVVADLDADGRLDVACVTDFGVSLLFGRAATVWNTPPGLNVRVLPTDPATGHTPARVTFSEVTGAGTTTLALGSAGPEPPAGFALGTPPVYDDIDTTAAYAGPVEVCLDYTGVQYQDESTLELWHHEDSGWRNVTTSLDTAADVVCGSVTSFSAFALLEPSTPGDSTPPTLSLPAGVTVAATGPQGALGGYVVSATDDQDPSPAVTCTPAAGSLFPLGSTTVACTATDAAGNTSSGSFVVRVAHVFDGFLPPIANDGSSIFKSGRTVPTKFRLGYADGTLAFGGEATLQVFKITDEILGTHEEITPDAAGASNTDNLFRFDPGSGQYIYDLKTTGYARGTYVLRATLADGTSHDVRVSIR